MRPHQFKLELAEVSEARNDEQRPFIIPLSDVAGAYIERIYRTEKKDLPPFLRACCPPVETLVRPSFRFLPLSDDPVESEKQVAAMDEFMHKLEQEFRRAYPELAWVDPMEAE